MDGSLIVVEGLVATDKSDWNVREAALELALDQRAFGPRRLLVAFADRAGRLLSIAHAPRTDPPEQALAPCIAYIGRGAPVAVAYCDEPVAEGPPPPDIGERFSNACAIVAAHGVHLVDWFACDDLMFRSSRIAVHPDGEWWDVPPDIDT